MITAKQQAETDQAIMEACKKLFFTTAIPEMCKTEGTPKQIEYLKDALLRELARREENKKARLIKRAHFPVYKAFEGYSYKQVQLPPALTKEELENVSFINQKQNLVLYGPVGVGKTHMAIAAGIKACMLGYKTRFYTVTELVLKLAEARKNGTLERLRNDLNNQDLLILDEWGYVPVDRDGSELLFQVISDSYESKSMILTTNLEFSKWGSIFTDEQMAAAMIDRLVHHGHLILREVEMRLLGVETNITNWQRRQNANNNFSAVVPYDMEQQRKESKEFMDDLTTRDQRMMFGVLTLVHTAETKEQLDADTDRLLSIGRKHLCQLAVLRLQQLDGLNTALPIGHRKIDAVRTLTTESLAVLMPFRTQEIMDEGGIYCGENAISHNLIMCNKEKLLNPNSFLLGVPGSGKSFSAKMLIVFLALATEDDILICDPEREYAALIEAMGGEVIRIAAGSNDRINAMDMVEGYGDGGNPVIDKSEFVLSLFEQLDKKGVSAKEKSIIDRCTAAVYEDYQRGGKVPTLCVLREKLLEQTEKEAKDLALSLELFTSGSLDAFAHESNVDVKNRMIVYDILDLGKQLKTMGLLVITDAMLNRVTENWKKGKRTHIFLDEFHVVFENEYSGAFFNSAWRRFRKRNAFPNAITQNVEYLLDSVLASTMLSNSEFIVMLNQAGPDRQKLAELLNISEEQMNYITNADAGCGLIKYGSALVPFVNRFPKNTRLYKLMTTKPGEDNVNRSR